MCPGVLKKCMWMKIIMELRIKLIQDLWVYNCKIYLIQVQILLVVVATVSLWFADLTATTAPDEDLTSKRVGQPTSPRAELPSFHSHLYADRTSRRNRACHIDLPPRRIHFNKGRANEESQWRRKVDVQINTMTQRQTKAFSFFVSDVCGWATEPGGSLRLWAGKNLLQSRSKGFQLMLVTRLTDGCWRDTSTSLRLQCARKYQDMPSLLFFFFSSVCSLSKYRHTKQVKIVKKNWGRSLPPPPLVS